MPATKPKSDFPSKTTASIVQWERARIECGRSWIRGPSGQTKDYQIGICCISTKHAAYKERKTNTGWLGIRI